MNLGGFNDWRGKRNHMNTQRISPLGPMHYSFTNYSTDHVKLPDLIQSDEMILNCNNLHTIPDPLKKNLADSVITGDHKKSKTRLMEDPKEYRFENTTENIAPNLMEGMSNDRHHYPSLGGINFITATTNIISGFFNVISDTMFHWRDRSPTQQYYDCCDQVSVSDRKRAPSGETWHNSNTEEQNKNERAGNQFSSDLYGNVGSVEMSADCKVAAAHCEDKLQKVKLLLTTNPVASTPKFRPRRPRKVFVEPNAVEETYEDAFSPEDFGRLANEGVIECVSPGRVLDEELSEAESSKVHMNVHESSSITETIPEDKVDTPASDKVDKDSTETVPSKEIETTKDLPETKEVTPPKSEDVVDTKQTVSSCEDKVNKLKALLQERRQKKVSEPQPIIETVEEKVKNKQKPIKIPSTKVHNKHYKNPNRLCVEKRKKSRLRQNINEDLMFANEIDAGDLSSVENSPVTRTPFIKTELVTESSPPDIKEVPEYFDEVSGRFRTSSTTESEDSFQIVFSDSPKSPRKREVSDCESEDSFIVFEDSPDNCYTTDDVFGDESGSDDESECEDSDTDDSDSEFHTSHAFSRTVGDLTDDSLYETKGSDEVDCCGKFSEGLPSSELVLDKSEVIKLPQSTGLLIDEAKKLKRKDKPPKSVHFSPNPPKVHVMRVWTFAAKQARMNDWMTVLADKNRFKRRIADVEMAIAWTLKPQHRSRVMFQRFMPWWNAQRRLEIAEKKEREAAEKLEAEKKEAERIEREKRELEEKAIADAKAKELRQEQILKGVDTEKLKLAVSKLDRFKFKKFNKDGVVGKEKEKHKKKTVNGVAKVETKDDDVKIENEKNEKLNNVSNNMQVTLIEKDELQDLKSLVRSDVASENL